MNRLAATAVAALALSSQAQTQMPYANRFDKELAGVFERRDQDWRMGPIVYQVLVDRFAPSAELEKKRHLYPAPRRLRDWSELPRRGDQIAPGLWGHEADFWGGDLASLAPRLDYVQGLGADVLYLNPIHLAYTNHKYDALDYLAISPEYGTREDVKRLAAELHRRGMKLVLDGVFNHMGRNAPAFRSAESDPASPYRDWFVFGPQYPGGARAWWNVENLPELNLENPGVREHIYGGRDSVVRQYLRDGVDGWRLDVAYDIGFAILEELTRAAHEEKPGSLVVGEIANYPREWFPSVDAVMHFTLRQLILRTVGGRLEPAQALRMIGRMVEETGIEPMLRSWIFLDNHDTARLATALPDARARRLAQVLQFTLPGSPNLYYGSELDMEGGEDPEMRAPMRWDLVRADHAPLAWTRKLAGLRKAHRALRVGNWRAVTSERLFAFERYTDRAADKVIVIVNPGSKPVSETLLVANSKLMDGSRLVDLLTGKLVARADSALIDITVPAQTALVLKPDVTPDKGYTNYKRVQ